MMIRRVAEYTRKRFLSEVLGHEQAALQQDATKESSTAQKRFAHLPTEKVGTRNAVGRVIEHLYGAPWSVRHTSR